MLPIKHLALALLVLQNTFLVVLMAYSRITKTENDRVYYASTAVLSMEVLKLVICCGVVAYQSSGLRGLTRTFHNEILRQPREMMKLAVPSVLYTVQNNLLYFALTHLDASTFQVGYQIKILTTALFSVLMLDRKLSPIQWLSLIILTVGVSATQLSANSSANENQNTTLGFVAVLMATVTSGFSGVYFEMILKNSSTSLWVRNIQMGIFSVFSGILGIYFSGELPGVVRDGFFYGYTQIVFWVVLLQGAGGLIVAVVVKYADNILKGFAASFSILTSCIFSAFLTHFRPTYLFIFGAVLVNVSMVLYAQYPPGKPFLRKVEKIDISEMA